jgi:hypothetical protein
MVGNNFGHMDCMGVLLAKFDMLGTYNIRRVIVLCILMSGGSTPGEARDPSAEINLSDAVIVARSGETIRLNAAEMLRDEIEKRTRIGLELAPSHLNLESTIVVIGTVGELSSRGLHPPPGMEVPSTADAYALWIDFEARPNPTVCVAGQDDRGTLYAVGRLLRSLRMTRDEVLLDRDLKMATAPRYALRGHQLGYRPKTNSYDGWTLRMWEQYYRDLIVFGANAVELIPPRSDDDDDSPHFPKPKLRMMVDMSQLAADYGLDVWIWFPAMDEGNDIFNQFRDEKAVNAAIEEWGEVFRALPKIDVVFVPGGDPGETHPEVLLPFLEKQKRNLNRYHPDAQMWMSPQGFDWRGKNREGWLRVFLDILQSDEPVWLDGIVFGPQVAISLPELRKEVPARYPIRRYPDITHSGGGQYEVDDWDEAYHRTLAREPINPRPYFYAKTFRDLQQYAIGTITYSEGCNDDVNKVIWSALGWDPDAVVEDILGEYSRYFISLRYEHEFADGLAALERNWAGPLVENEGVYKTLELFQEMERNATPQDRLNWRFQQGLYRAYYDAYIKARLHHETELESQAVEVLRNAQQVGSLAAMDQAEAILDRAEAERVKPEWRARAFELAEALFQSIRMQMSVPRYQAIRLNRGATLDTIDEPLNDSVKMKRSFYYIREVDSESKRLEALAKLVD